ncbi:EAL domain-containing protein [Pseudoalteromonas xiamenensis]
MKKFIRSIFSTVDQFLKSRFILSVREAFIALLPYFVSSAVAILLLNTVTAFGWYQSDSGVVSRVKQGAELILALFPVMVSFSLGFFLSKNYGTSGIVGGLLALLCFAIHGHFVTEFEGNFIVNYQGASAYSIVIPILSSIQLKALLKWSPKFPIWLGSVSPFLKEKLLLLLPFSLVFFSFFLWLPLLDLIGSYIAAVLQSLMKDSSIVELTAQRMLLSHAFWFVGVHGDNTYNLLFDSRFLTEDILPGISAKTFYDTFVLIGGTGCFVGLVLAAMLLPKRSHERHIAFLSIPFSVFNFCEIILYGLPIFLNPILMIPFFLTPIFNFVVAYWVLDAGWIPFNDIEISWMTPTLVNGWIVGSSWHAVALQGFLILVNTAIYYPFLSWHHHRVNYQQSLEQLSEQLALTDAFNMQQESKYIARQSEQGHINKEIRAVITELSRGTLMLYYQPQVYSATTTCCGFEALLRLKTKDGKVVGPYFLDVLGAHHQSVLIDLWVIDTAAKDLERFQQVGLKPCISINLHPDSLLKDDIVNRIIRRFKRYPKQLIIEVVESSYLSDRVNFIHHIEKLREHFIETALDDFGSGYSSLSMLADLPVNLVKLDKQFLDRCDSSSGCTLYSNVVKLLHDQGHRLVAEGVESHKQYEYVKSLGIEKIQGWYFEKALPLNEAIDFINRDSESIVRE